MFKIFNKKKIFIILIILGLTTFVVKFFLSDKIIGLSNHPGFHGEILFGRNIIYNFKIGNLFNFFITDYLSYPIGKI